jgi:DNA-binding winged helix-turn-helix (wHTH) protein
MIFSFGDCDLDTDSFELRRGGILERVEPQVFEVLRYLLLHRDRLVTKNELLDNVWGDRFVSESALTSRIKAARRAVGDDGSQQHTIRTVHGRGYRFIADVVERSDDTAEAVSAPSTRAEPSPSALFPADDLQRDAGERLAWPMIGRAAPLRVLADSIADDDCGGVLVTGNAGVGKTRLVDELVVHLEGTGSAVARASGHPEIHGIPLASFAHLLPADVATAAGPGGALDRGVVFHAARQALETSAGGARPVLVVDDADQIDELSRALLASLVLSRSVIGVLTMRTDGGPTPFDRLVKDGHLRRIDLEPLAPETVETLLHRALGGPMVAESVDELVSSALGNPGVVRQLVESTLDAGTLIEHDGVWRLTGPLRPTASMRELIAHRLTDLGGEHRHVTEVLAVAGRLGLDLLVRMVGDEPIEDLERRGLVTVRTSRRRTDVELAHPLFGEVVSTDMPVSRGRRIRRELADALDAAGARRRDDGPRLVAWRLDGGGHVSLDRLFQAARLALIEGEHDLAERLLRQAVADGGGAEATWLMAELHFRRGDPQQVETLLSTIDLEQLDETTRSRAVRRRSGNLFYGLTRPNDALAAADEGLAHITEPVARLRVEAARAVIQVMSGDVGGTLDATTAIPSREVDPLVRFEIVRARSLAQAAAGRCEDALELVTEGEVIHQEFDDDLHRPGVTVLEFNRLTALTELGRLAEARARLEGHRAERSDPNAVMWQAFAGARLELYAGNPIAALALGEGPARWSRAYGQWGAERWILALVGMARLLAGDVTQGADDIDRVRSLETSQRGLFSTDRDRAYGWLAMTREGPDAASEILLGSARDARQRGAFALEAMVLHDVVRFGLADRVADRLTQLASQIDGVLIEARSAQASGVAEGDPDRLSSSVDMFERHGSPLFAAEAATQLSLLHHAAGSADEAAAAAARARSLRAEADASIVSPLLTSLDA